MLQILSLTNADSSCGYGITDFLIVSYNCLRNDRYIAPADRKHRQQASRRSGNPLQIWHAFPYHPLWANTISRFIGTFFGDRMIRACLAIVFGHEADVRLRVAWSLAALPFGATLVAW